MGGGRKRKKVTSRALIQDDDSESRERICGYMRGGDRLDVGSESSTSTIHSLVDIMKPIYDL